MYLDPGTGSMIIQVIVAAFAAIGGMWLILKKEIKGWFNKKRGIVEKVAEKDISDVRPDFETDDRDT